MRTNGFFIQALQLRLLRVTRFAWNRLAGTLVSTGRFSAAGDALARAALQRVQSPLSRHRTVLLGGLSRVGKSTLAVTLAARHGFRHVNLDYLVNRIYAVNDPADRARFRTSFYHRMLSRVPVGHVIEGDDLVLLERWHDSDRFGQEPLDLSMLSGLAKAFALPAFVVGNAEADLEQRLTSLREDDGWVTELSEADLRAYVEFVMQGSAFLGDRSQEAGVTYLEVGATDFRVTMETLADRVAQDAR